MSTIATETNLGDIGSSSASDKSKSASPPSERGAPTRNKRRSHKKSRAGCENCKVRRVKCDESRPKCNKCINYGIECNYDSKSGGMLFAGESSFAMQPPVKVPEHGALVLKPLTKSSGPMPPLRTLEDQFTPSKWMSADLDILSKFQERTVLTVGSRTNANLYKNEVFKLAINYPFLTHVVVTLTLLHDRHLTGLTNIGERAALHWYQGTAMFQDALLKPEKQSQRDALWASASMLGCIQFAAIEARTPEEAWPLAPPSNNDLDWLKMSDGKKAVWRICQANKTASVFSTLKGHVDIYRPIIFDGHEIANVTREFCDVFGLGPSSNAEENPYHGAAMSLARLLPIDCDEKTILEFLVCMTQISPKLKILLYEKEPKALLLVACWYAKIYRYQWWIHRRGLLEGQAICIYLDRFYSHASSLQNLLKFPKMAFGLAFATSEADQLQTVLAIRPRTAAAAG